MTSIHKTIKTCAKILAALIIAGIVYSAVSLVSGIFGIFWEDEYEAVKNESFEDVTALDIDLEASELTIKIGDGYSVETNNKKVSARLDGSELEIDERQFFGVNNNSKIILTIPENSQLDSVSISAGAGNIVIERLFADKASIEMGAGNLTVKACEITGGADIEGGVGNITIESGIIYDLDLEMGVGNVNITAGVLGTRSTIECGVGDLDLSLSGGARYTVDCSVGVGSFRVDGNKVSGNQIIGTGRDRITIDGGVGSVNVHYNDQDLPDYDFGYEY